MKIFAVRKSHRGTFNSRDFSFFGFINMTSMDHFTIHKDKNFTTVME